MKVSQNMEFALKIAGMKRPEIDVRVHDAAAMLDLEEYLGRKPGQLSGGQRQRVAMGRAIVRQPRVFLMDEPLSNLDAKLRVATRSQIAALQRRLGITTVYVTHDQVEAMTMGDRVAVMNNGVLQQVDEPRRLYSSPVNAFVAGFIGSPAMNLIEGKLAEGGVTIGSTVLKLPPALVTAAAARSGDVTVGLRPEALSLNGPAGIPAVVNLVEELGSEAYIYAQLSDRPADSITAPNDVIVRVDPDSAPQSGATIKLHVDPEAVLLFDAQTGARITAG